MKKIFIITIILLMPFFAIAKCPEGSSYTGDDVCLDNPIGGQNPNVNEIIGTVINGLMGVVGSLALVMFIYGGLTWMLAAGNAQRVDKGKQILTWATVGLIVIFSSYALVKFIVEAVAGTG